MLLPPLTQATFSRLHPTPYPIQGPLYQYPDGALYQGPFQNQKKHGLGKKLFSNGAFYLGSFVNDQA